MSALLVVSQQRLTNYSVIDAEDQVQRQWHKQLQVVFAWLLPEHAVEAHIPDTLDVPSAQQNSQQQGPPISQHQAAENSNIACQSVTVEAASDGKLLTDSGFGAAELYAAVKPQGNEPELPGNNARLRPTLRPYQKRAAAWMVAREQGTMVCIPFTNMHHQRVCSLSRCRTLPLVGDHFSCCWTWVELVKANVPATLITLDSALTWPTWAEPAMTKRFW